MRLCQHQASCANWPVDGLLLRHYLIGEPRVSAGMATSAMHTAIQAMDAADFPGIRRPDASAVICCPHFGCDEGFHSREEALWHAVGCTRQRRPPCVAEWLAERSLQS